MLKRQSLRLPDYKYNENGVYFVTICTYKKRCLFGHIADGRMIANEWGNIVKEEWLRSESLRKNVELDMFVLMPNHLHGIIIISDDQVPANATRFSTLKAGSLGAIIGQFKSIVTKRVRRLPDRPDHLIWQRNYYENVIRTHKIWNRIRKYVATNPERWFEDSLFVS